MVTKKETLWRVICCIRKDLERFRGDNVGSCIGFLEKAFGYDHQGLARVSLPFGLGGTNNEST